MVPARTKRGIAVLSVLLAISIWASRQYGPEEADPIEGLDTRFDYTLNNFQLRMYDEDGKPSVTIAAPRLANDAATGIGTIDQPELVVVHEGALWNIMADSATVSDDQEIVNLNGTVLLNRGPRPGITALDITALNVTLKVTPKQAHSAAAVQVNEPGAQLSGIGFELDMTNDQYTLLSDVKGVYEAQN